MFPNDHALTEEEKEEQKNDPQKVIQNVSTFEFDQEIQQLSQQLKEKISSLKKDYRDLKIFKNEDDIANAREKLLVFVRKLITDTNFLITSIQRNFDRNIKAVKKDISKDDDSDGDDQDKKS